MSETRCRNCGHTEPHTGPAGDIADGLRCATCGVDFVLGQPIGHKLDSIIDGVPAMLIVCRSCETKDMQTLSR